MAALLAAAELMSAARDGPAAAPSLLGKPWMSPGQCGWLCLLADIVKPAAAAAEAGRAALRAFLAPRSGAAALASLKRFRGVWA